MKLNRHNLLVLLMMIVTAALYRALPYDSRPFWLGAPQLAMAIFAGSVVANRKWAFAFPIISMLLADVVMQIMHTYSPSMTPGFYKGQWLNYLIIASITVIGFFTSSRKASQIFGALLAGPTVFFLLSNFSVWAGGGGLGRAKTTAGLLQCYVDGLPFYYNSLMGTLIFGAVLFGIYQASAMGKLVKAKA
jgi:hypothetical protein